jgi:ribosome-binding protein aMBF1 (putative translation factor)
MKWCKEEIKPLYDTIKTHKGWLSFCWNCQMFDSEDIKTLEDLGREESLEERQAKEYARARVLEHSKKLSELTKECNEDYGERWGDERRAEYLSGRIDSKTNLIKRILKIYKELDSDKSKLKNKIAFVNASGIEKLENEIQALHRNLMFLESKRFLKEGKIQQADIVKATQYPIGGLVEINKRGFAFCPYHSDGKTPNFYTKNNFGYCFSCGKSASVIDLYMKIHNVGFIDAVKALQ